MLAGTVSNRQVYTVRETSHLKDPLGIGKCPFALMRADFEPKNVILMVRDPAYIVTSTSHGDFEGKYMFGWVEDESAAKKALVNNWEAMKKYLAPKRGRGAFLVRYEDLIQHPNEIQNDLAAEFGFEYTQNREFANWPDGYKVDEYWLKALGKPRKLKPRSIFNPEQKVRLAKIEARHPDYNDCRKFLGYGP